MGVPKKVQTRLKTPIVMPDSEPGVSELACG